LYENERHIYFTFIAPGSPKVETSGILGQNGKKTRFMGDLTCNCISTQLCRPV